MRISLTEVGLRYVRQGHSTGCGIACVAMLAGVSYSDAYSILKPRLEGYTSHHTNAADLRFGLDRFGIRLLRGSRATSWWSVSKLSLMAVNRNAAVDRWHWVIYVPMADRPFVLDPQSKVGIRRDFSRMRPYFSYHVQR